MHSDLSGFEFKSLKSGSRNQGAILFAKNQQKYHQKRVEYFIWSEGSTNLSRAVGIVYCGDGFWAGVDM